MQGAAMFPVATYPGHGRQPNVYTSRPELFDAGHSGGGRAAPVRERAQVIVYGRRSVKAHADANAQTTERLSSGPIDQGAVRLYVVNGVPSLATYISDCPLN